MVCICIIWDNVSGIRYIKDSPMKLMKLIT